MAARASLDATPQSPPLPQIQLLAQLGSALTPSEKERLSLSVLALRMYFLAECDRAGHEEAMRFEVRDPVPRRPLKAARSIPRTSTCRLDAAGW